MLQKFQRFGGAMMGPVMLMMFSSILIGLSSIFTNPAIMGSLAVETTMWFKIWTIMYSAGNAVFAQLPLMFVICLPLKLADKAPGQASVSSMLLYFIYNYYIEGILGFWGNNFGVDFSQEVGGTSGLTTIASIKTLDTNVVGAIITVLIVVYLHNKFYEKKLPEILNAFQGTSLVVIVGTFVMLPVAYLTCLIWPTVQNGFIGLQTFLSNSGTVGVFLFTFLERVTIPTGLHHFLWVPFDLGPIVQPDGNWAHWLNNINEFAASTTPLKEQFSSGGFALYGNFTVWGIPAIAFAMYKLALPQNKKKVLGLLLPLAITSMLTGVSEPIEFIYLFLAFPLFVVNAILSGIMSAVLYTFGVVGYQGAGLIDYFTVNWIPMFNNHSNTVITHIIIGIIFSIIYYFVAYFYFKKFNVQTPGRSLEAINTNVLENKEITIDKNESPFKNQASIILDGLGGAENIESLTNCMTRLRVNLKDPNNTSDDDYFKEAKAHGVVRNGNAIQVIIGMDVENIRNEIDKLI